MSPIFRKEPEFDWDDTQLLQPATEQIAAIRDAGRRAWDTWHQRQTMMLPQSQAVMTLNPPRPGFQPTPQALEVRAYLLAKVRIIRKRGQLDRISDETLAMLPAMRLKNKQTTARMIVDEAAALLRSGGES